MPTFSFFAPAFFALASDVNDTDINDTTDEISDDSSVPYTVLLFAALKDAAKSATITICAPRGNVSVTKLLRLGAAQFPAIAPFLPYVRVAVNFEYSNLETTLSPRDEIAFLPPVSGGSSENLSEIEFPIVASPIVQITHGVIDTPAISRATERCLDGGAGAVLTFEGVVRNNAQGQLINFLEYFAYEAMAQRTLQQISDEVRARWDLPCSIVHRLGKLEIGEASVVICVASAHRAESFEACRYAIERIKESVPIWKKETARDGSSWVGNLLSPVSPKPENVVLAAHRVLDVM